MLCILYVIAMGTLAGVAGVLIERALPARFPRRWIWCIIIPASLFIPGYYRTHHSWSVSEAFAQQTVEAPLGHTLQTASLTALDPALWTHMASYDKAIGRVWLIASALLVVWGLVNLLRVLYVVHASRWRRGGSGTAMILDGVPIVITDSMGPATVGLWRSRVLVPRWVLALPGTQRQYVLRHEDEHRRSHDAAILFVASLTLIMAPWNLALWWQLRRLSLAIEMDCDNRVVAELGDATAYGELLLKVAQAASPGPRLQPAFLGGMGMLERRLTMLLAPTPLRHVQRFLLPAVAIGLFFLMLLTPHPVLSKGPHAHGTKPSGVTMTAPTLPVARSPEANLPQHD
jgi:beta-lactamase regulating signal transducer with metallopeptidase domain